MMTEGPGAEPHWKPEFDRLMAQMKAYQGRGVLYLEIAIPASPAPDELAMADAGMWPVRMEIVELQPELRDMIDFLIEGAASRWPTT